MNNLKEPKHFLIFRIIGFLLLFIGALLIVLGCAVFRTERSVGDGTIMNFALFVPGVFLCIFCIPCLITGFAPKINKMQIESHKYMQQSNKNNLKDIASTSADITGDAVTKTAKAIKNGLKETKFCKHCGAEIDYDSKFCKECGKNQ